MTGTVLDTNVYIHDVEIRRDKRENLPSSGSLHSSAERQIYETT